MLSEMKKKKEIILLPGKIKFSHHLLQKFLEDGEFTILDGVLDRMDWFVNKRKPGKN